MKLWRVVYFVLELEVPVHICERIHEDLYPVVMAPDEVHLKPIQAAFNQVLNSITTPTTDPRCDTAISLKTDPKSVFALGTDNLIFGYMVEAPNRSCLVFRTKEKRVYCCVHGSSGYRYHTLHWPILRDEIHEAFMCFVEESQKH